MDGAPVIFHTEKLTMADPESASDLSRVLAEKEVVICNEVGCGIIPVEPRERRGREATGRLCILLAQQAEAVVRMVCGIPCVIKGTLTRFAPEAGPAHPSRPAAGERYRNDHGPNGTTPAGECRRQALSILKGSRSAWQRQLRTDHAASPSEWISLLHRPDR